MVGKYGSKEFWRGDWVLFGENVNGLLLGVRSYDDRVVCLGVASKWSAWLRLFARFADLRGFDVTLEQRADGHLNNGLDAIGFFVHLVETDIVLAIACVAELGHGELDDKWYAWYSLFRMEQIGWVDHKWERESGCYGQCVDTRQRLPLIYIQASIAYRLGQLTEAADREAAKASSNPLICD